VKRSAPFAMLQKKIFSRKQCDDGHVCRVLRQPDPLRHHGRVGPHVHRHVCRTQAFREVSF